MTHRLTVDQVAVHAYRAGFRGQGLVTAVAVSGAETGGSFDADLNSPPNHTSGPDNGSIDRGLWQLNSYWHREVSNADAHDPDAAARAAYRISNGGTNWRAWSTYNSGAYKKYRGEAISAGAKASGGRLDAAGDSSGSPAFLGPDNEPAVDIRIGGQQATRDLGYALIGGSMSMTTQEASALELLFDDNDYRIWDQFKLAAGPDGTVVEAYDLRWRCFAVGTEPGSKGPATRLTLQPSGVMRMRGYTPKPAKHMSPTDYMAIQAATAGLRFRGEQSAKRPDIAPQKVNDAVTGEKRDEYAWEMGQRLAVELNFIAYESGGVYHFGSPQQLAESAKLYQLSVNGMTIADGGDLLKPWGSPTVRASQLNQPGKPPARTLDCQLSRDDIERLRAGLELLLVGIPQIDNIPSMTITSIGWDVINPLTPGRLQAVDRSLFYSRYATTADQRASAPVVSNDSGDVAGVAHAGTKSALDFVTFCLQQIGDTYVWGAGRNTNDPNPDSFDCSGLVYWAANKVGVHTGTVSGTQYEDCAAHGRLISIEKAAFTRGALLFEGYHGATHVAVSLGDGQHTIEARGRAYGVNKQPIQGRPWSGAGLIPGMRYS